MKVQYVLLKDGDTKNQSPNNKIDLGRYEEVDLTRRKSDGKKFTYYIASLPGIRLEIIGRNDAYTIFFVGPVQASIGEKETKIDSCLKVGLTEGN